MQMEDVNLVLADTKANASHAGTDSAHHNQPVISGIVLLTYVMYLRVL